MKQWFLQVMAGRSSYPVDIAGHRKMSIGRLHTAASGNEESRAALQQASLVIREGSVWIDASDSSVAVYVNDILTRGSMPLRRGDEVRVGHVSFVLNERMAERNQPVRIADADELLRRLDEEIDRSLPSNPPSPPMRSVGLLAIVEPSSGSAARQAFVRRAIDLVKRHEVVATWARFGVDLICCVLADCTDEQLQRIEQDISMLATPRTRAAMVVAPRDGSGGEELQAAMWRSLRHTADEPDPPRWADPVMVRLAHLVGSLSAAEGSVCFVGGEGAGRMTLARLYLEAIDPSAEVVSCLDAHLDKKLASLDDNRWIILRDVDREVPISVLNLRGRPLRRVICTASQRPAGRNFESVIEVPALATRPDDIVYLSDHFLSKTRRMLARPKLCLSDDVSRLLQVWHWPGNVRELENVMIRAARASVRDEIGRDVLPIRMLQDAPSRDFQSAIDDAERSILLESLSRTRWNVSAAATRLQLPRRTLVHRMARLGLRRPMR